MIVKTKSGYEVVSEHRDAKGKRKRLGKYKTLEEAKKRLGQIEFFKHKGGK